MNKDNYNHEQCGRCPEDEFLSSYFDNELDRTSPEFIHISSCPECMVKIDSFARIGEIINKNVSAQCYPALSEDILKKVRGEISEEKNTEIPFYLIQFLKIAAIIILAVGLFTFIHSMSGNKAQVADNAAHKTATESPSVSPAPPTTQNSRENTLRKNLMPENEIQFSNMSNVSTGLGTGFHSKPPPGAAAKTEPVIIPDNVTHVWTVKNLKNASDEITACTSKLGIQPGGVSLSKDDDNMIRYSMNLTKKQISGFVKLFSSAGNELLSSAAPQPEQNLFYGNATDPVGYEVKLVQKDK